MSTHINDFASTVLLQNASADPGAKTATVTGAALDFITADGRCFAIQNVGAVSGTTPTLDGKVQDADAAAGPWFDAPDSNFTQVTASNSLQARSFYRRRRFLRYVGTIAGTTPSFALSVVLGEPLKQLGG